MIFDLDISKKEGQNKIQGYSRQGLFLERDEKIQQKSLTLNKSPTFIQLFLYNLNLIYFLSGSK